MTRRAMKRELLLAAALGLAVFGPSLALAQRGSAPAAQSPEHGRRAGHAAAEAECGKSASVASADRWR